MFIMADRIIYQELGAITEPQPNTVLRHLDFISKLMAETFESPDESAERYVSLMKVDIINFLVLCKRQYC